MFGNSLMGLHHNDVHVFTDPREVNEHVLVENYI